MALSDEPAGSGSHAGAEASEYKMAPDRWRKVRSIFLQALEAPAGTRAATLKKLCGDDINCRRRVEALLRADALAERCVWLDAEAPGRLFKALWDALLESNLGRTRRR